MQADDVLMQCFTQLSGLFSVFSIDRPGNIPVSEDAPFFLWANGGPIEKGAFLFV
jgi:hypothetical protein